MRRHLRSDRRARSPIAISRRLRSLTLIVSAFLALALAGCGGDDDGGTPGADGEGTPASASSPSDPASTEAKPSDELDREGYGDAVRTIFTPYLDDYEELEGRLRRSIQSLTVNDASELVDAVREIQHLHRQTTSELRSIDPPGATTAGHEALIGALTEISDAHEGLVAAGRAFDPYEIEPALKLQRRAVKAIERAQAKLPEALEELEAAGVPLQRSRDPGADR